MKCIQIIVWLRFFLTFGNGSKIKVLTNIITEQEILQNRSLSVKGITNQNIIINEKPVDQIRPIATQGVSNKDRTTKQHDIRIKRAIEYRIWPFHHPSRRNAHGYPNTYGYPSSNYPVRPPPWWSNGDRTFKEKGGNDDNVYILKPSDYPPNYKPITRNGGSPVCGRTSKLESQRIVGGSTVAFGEHPWMALIQYRGRTKINNGCGGTVVSSRYVLTAGHCVDETILRNRNLQLYRIVLGEFDTTQDPDCSDSPNRGCADMTRIFTPLDIIKHEQFDNVNAIHDIALIQLDREIRFSDYIKPICLLPANFKYSPNDLVTVIGWGRLSTKGSYPSILTKASLPIVDRASCNNQGVQLIDQQICLGLGNGIDTCSGDSGGPTTMQRMENSELVTYQIGIISYGFQECGQAPSVNTYLPPYVDWIRSKIGQNL